MPITALFCCRVANLEQLEKVAVANALQLEGRTTSRQSFQAVFGQFCPAIYRRPVRILTSPLDSATPIS